VIGGLKEVHQSSDKPAEKTVHTLVDFYFYNKFETIRS